MPYDFPWPPAAQPLPDLSYPFVLKAGDVMTGALTLFGPPTSPLHAATKAYVDATSAGTGFLPLAGGTLTGPLIGTTLSLSGTLTAAGALVATSTAQLGATTIVTPGTGGTGLLTVGLGASNHIVLNAPVAGTQPSIAATGTDGLLITAPSNGQIVMPRLNLGNNQTITWSGTATSSTALTPMYVSNSWIGDASAATASPTLNRIAIEQDNITSPTFPTQGLLVNYRFGGTTTTGSRFGMTVAMNQNVVTNDATAGVDPNYVAANFWAFANFNVGGTGTTMAGSKGHIFGSNPQAVLSAGATNWNHAAGEEINVNITNNVTIRSGLTVASVSGAGKGVVTDAAIWLYGEGAKWTTGIEFGGPTQAWSFDTGSSIVDAVAGAGTTPVAQWGVDFNEVTFPSTGNAYDGGFLRSSGFSVDGAGTTRIGTTYLTPSTAGLAIDAKGAVGTVVTGAVPINAGGTGYTSGTGTDIARDLYGGVYVLTVAAGVVTAINAVISQPVYPSTSPPATSTTTTLGTTSAQGSGLVLNLTWRTTATALSLNPSAGATTVGGSLTVNGTGTSLTVAHAMSVTGLATLSGGFTGNGVGGVLSGANAFLQVGNGGVRTYSGAASAAQASVLSEEILRGTVASGLQPVNYLWVPDDGAVGPTSNGQIATLQIVHTCTTNAVGNRWGTDISMSNSAAASAGAAAAGGVSFGGIRAQTFPSFNVGGTGVAFATSQGVNFGANITALAQGTATNLRTVTGMEIDVGITAGASSYSKEGLKIVLLSTDAVQGAVIDYGFSIQSQVQQASGVGFKTGIVFGGNGGFGVAATGTLIGAFVGVGGMTAALGIDFSGVTFSETPIKLPVLTNAANDAAAAAAGISVGGFYRTGSAVMQRVV